MGEFIPEVLIISNTRDFATDHVVNRLRSSGVSYLRLNRDEFERYELSLSVSPPSIYGKTTGIDFAVRSDSLRSIYFRAPVYLREIHPATITPDEQLSRTQWAAFTRSLQIFEDVHWVNHPQATYRAEVKPIQLLAAKKVGFTIPKTLVTNSLAAASATFCQSTDVVVKTLDPLIIADGDEEAFIYSNFVPMAELRASEISSAPTVVQESITPKTDMRVTVIGDQVFAVEITRNGEGISGDWRRAKNGLDYIPVVLPKDVETACTQITADLGLVFGALDLALRGGEYFFLEINPTGEWAWLLESQPGIDKAIVDALIRQTP
jgi:glutathione synthase/RimK-type ligase-like ATP-grasp enzyme